MSNSLGGSSRGNSYLGTKASQPPNCTFSKVNPTVDDKSSASYSLLDFWLNTETEDLFVLTSVANNTAIWTPITTGSAGAINQITTDSGIALPVAGNINIETGGPGLSGTTLFKASASTVFLKLDETLNGNMGLGTFSLGAALTSGSDNICVGGLSGGSITIANTNSSLGSQSLRLNIDGDSNCAFGTLSLGNAIHPAYNTALGTRTGTAYTTTESSNILIGYNTVGTLGESNTLRIGVGTGTGNGQLNRAFIQGVAGVSVSNLNTVTINTVTGQLGSTAGGGGGTTQFTADTGTAAPSGGNINLNGDTVNTLTAASGDTVIVTLANNLLISGDYTTTAGNVVLTSGLVSLPNTVSDPNGGPIQIGGHQYLSNFGTRNLFIGDAFGNTRTNAGGFVDNTSLGFEALLGASGGRNTGIGSLALQNVTVNSDCTAVGYNACNSGDGTGNTCIGSGAGSGLAPTDAYNVILGFGIPSPGESNVMRLGATSGPGTIAETFIAGIDGVDVGSVATVVTEAGNQLGTAVITAGSGITVTPGSNTITIAATGGGGSITITGDTGGGLSGSSFTFDANTQAGSSVSFSGAGTTISLNTSDASANTIIGSTAGSVTAINGVGNTGLGEEIFNNLNGGGFNTSIGIFSTLNLITGTDNIVIGTRGGENWLTNESNNILIASDSSGTGSRGTTGDQNVLRIGCGTGTGGGQMNSAFISGIQGITVTGSAVFVSSSDQLGIAVSSRRFKENIYDMPSMTEFIMKLRPVTFNYNSGDDKSTQYGLIAEEVNDILPQLVVLDKQGIPQTVKYHDLPSLLLSEIQNLRKEVEELKRRL